GRRPGSVGRPRPAHRPPGQAVGRPGRAAGGQAGPAGPRWHGLYVGAPLPPPPPAGAPARFAARFDHGAPVRARPFGPGGRQGTPPGPPLSSGGDGLARLPTCTVSVYSLH